MRQVKISASIMCANWMALKEDLKILERNKIDYIHYDVMDGFFAPEYGLFPHLINEIKNNVNIPGDYHFMVEEPSRMLENFKPSSGDIISIHYEACRNLHRDLVNIRKMGARPGVVLNPATPINAIEYVIDEVDYVKVMTVNPGYAGQKLVPQTLSKIEKLVTWRKEEGLTFEISVDGNVNRENIPNMVRAGADVLIGGSSGLFRKDIPLEESIELFRSYVEEGLKDEN